MYKRYSIHPYAILYGSVRNTEIRTQLKFAVPCSQAFVQGWRKESLVRTVCAFCSVGYQTQPIPPRVAFSIMHYT